MGYALKYLTGVIPHTHSDPHHPEKHGYSGKVSWLGNSPSLGLTLGKFLNLLEASFYCLIVIRNSLSYRLLPR